MSINDTLATKDLINASLRTNTKDNILKGLAYETMGNVLLNKTNLYSLGPTSTARYKFSHQRHVRFEKSSEKETNSMILSITKQPRNDRQFVDPYGQNT
ncbi:MAG: hypothetical protein CM15mP83_0720 [Flavobacteriaceae bacterium]|nr:MAG: hypothetical protein CM15mP83_0720 [Flavobacteriaceae bacterium]